MTVFLHSCLCTYVNTMCHYFIFQGFGKPNVYHATIVIFLEFFAWGLLTSPMLTVSPNIKYFLFLNKLNQSLIEIFKCCDN